MNTGKLLEVRNLQKFYNKDGVPTKALNGITFDVFPETSCQGLFNQIHKKATKKCQKHFHAPDTQMGEVTCVCLTVHRKDTHILATGRYRVSNAV